MTTLRKALTSALAAGGILASLSSSSFAGQIVFDTWTSYFPTPPPNYNVTVDDSTAGMLDFSVTVNPWNTEALGIFFDLGNNDINPALLGLTSADPVVLFSSDTASPNCGAGCSIQLLMSQIDLNTGGDDEWEMVFRLGEETFDNIQTFNFSINDMGFGLSDFVQVGIRSQQTCHGTDLLPGDLSDCYWGDKSFSASPQLSPGPTVSEPGTLSLIALALAMAGSVRAGRRKSA